MKQLILLILSALLLFSCLTQKKKDFICSTCSTKTIIKDSVSTLTIKKDTIIYVTKEGENIYFQAPCDSMGIIKYFKPIVKSNKGLTTTLSIKDGVLSCESKIDSLQVVIEGLKTIVSSERIVTETKEIEVNNLTKFQKFCTYWFWFCCGCALFFIIMAFFRLKK